MPTFGRKRQAPVLARGVFTIQKGIGLLQAGEFDAAIKEFRKVAASRNSRTERLVRSVAAFYIYNTERFRRESKKVSFGNSHLMNLEDTNSGDAWSDTDIAAVLVAPNNNFTNRFLAAFLGRSEEAVRFQRRYTGQRPLRSWVAESGSRYTRFTQNRRVARKLGFSN